MRTCAGARGRRHASKAAVLGVLVLLFVCLLNFQPSVHAEEIPVLYVDPQVTVAMIDSTFSVNVTVANVTDLCSWQIYFYYSNEVLEAQAYAEGEFLSSYGPTMFEGSFNNNFNSTHGELWMYGLRTWSGGGVNGSGVLGSATFEAKGGGSTPFGSTQTILGNSTAQRITHTVLDGEVFVGLHNLALISLVPLKTVVGQGFRVRINGTIHNTGNYTEIFNITAYANLSEVQTLNSSVLEGDYASVMIPWDTSAFSYGNYTLSGEIPPIPLEINTTDNSLTDGVVVVTIPGDMKYDKIVDIFDAIILSTSFDSNPSSPNWNPNADINDDDSVDIFDAIILATHFEESIP